jgi:hypothetical protein
MCKFLFNLLNFIENQLSCGLCPSSWIKYKIHSVSEEASSSETLWILYFIFYPRRWTKSTRQMVLNVIYHRQNLLEFIVEFHFSIFAIRLGSKSLTNKQITATTLRFCWVFFNKFLENILKLGTIAWYIQFWIYVIFHSTLQQNP